jgi:chemotaxis family two-component system sensor histidine kinase/response regulator PixL
MNLVQQAYSFFIEEASHLLQDIERGLNELGQEKLKNDSSARKSKVREIVRAVDSLKGGSASVGLQVIKNIAEKLAEYLKSLYNQELQFDLELEQLFWEGFNCLKEPLSQQIKEGKFDQKEAEKKANSLWEKFELKLSNIRDQVEDYTVSSADLGIDIVSSIFETDVAKEIQRLKGIITSPEYFNLEVELTESIQILAGFGELLDLEGFLLIANTAQSALEKHPKEALIIAKLLVKDVENSRKLVLHGERNSGGKPCELLVSLAQNIELTEFGEEKLLETETTAPEIDDSAYKFFWEEVAILMQELERNLEHLKIEKTFGKLDEIIRITRSIKSGAASVGFEEIKDLAHKLEEIFQVIYNKNISINTDLETCFSDAFQYLSLIIEQQKTEGIIEDLINNEASKILEKIEQYLSDQLTQIAEEDLFGSNQENPDNPDKMNTYVLESMFEIDIAQGIEHLSNIIDTIEPQFLQEELKLQGEMFLGFGQMLNLQGFTEIAETTLLALEKNPNQVKTIARLMLNDVRAFQQAILTGNLNADVKPSTKLLELAELTTPFEETPITNNISQLESSLIEESESELSLDFADLVTENEQELESSLVEESELSLDFADLVTENEQELESSLVEESESELSLDFVDLVTENEQESESSLVEESELSLDFADLVTENEQELESSLVEESESELIPDFADLVLVEESELIPNFADLVTENELESQANDTQEDAQISLTSQELEELNPEFIESVISNITDFGEGLPEDIFSTEGLEIEQVTQNPQEEQNLELQRQAYQFFIEEAPELLDLIDTGLEAVINNRNAHDVHDIARAAHSLKGGARSAGLEDLGNIAFRVEKSFKALYNEEIELDQELTIYLQEVYQTLRNSLKARIDNQEWDEVAELAKADEIWEQITAKLGSALEKAQEYLPSSSDLGIDIATSIFEVDVAGGIESLSQALSSGDTDSVRDELTTQIDVFLGFGEMLDLPGFVEICQKATEALTNSPERVLDIAQYFLQDVQTAKDLVLAGDRSTGGQPSPELLALTGDGSQESLGLSRESDEYSPLESETLPLPTLDSSLGSETLPLPPIPTYDDYEEAPIDMDNQAYHFFIEEAPELLGLIESGLLTLRQERTTAKVHEIMRAAHSIKGGAASVGLEAIKTISHKLEDIFKAFYNQEVEIDTELETWLLEGYDCLRNPLIEQLETGTYNPRVALTNAEQVWQKIQQRMGDALARPDDYVPSSADLGVDIVSSMFDVDVEQELDRLRAVIAEPDQAPLAGELRATLEVFAGFGEMLNLPGFADIANKGLRAIELNPNYGLEIINLIIQDVEAARTLVLNGDRKTGGKASPELCRYAEEVCQPLNPQEWGLPSSSGGQTPPELVVGGAEVPSLEDVFGVEGLEPIDHLWEGEEETESELPSLEEIFTAELVRNEIDLIEEATAKDLEEQEEDSGGIPSLEDVFGAPDLTVLESVELSEDTETDTVPSLEDVFGLLEEPMEQPSGVGASRSLEVPSLEVPSLEVPSLEVPSLEVPSLEVPSLEVPSLEQIQEQPPSLATPQEQLTETPVQKNGTSAPVTGPITSPLELEEAVSAISDIYSQLPGLQSEQEINPLIRTKPESKDTTLDTTSRSSATPSTAKKPESATKTNLTVRIDLDRLERLNNLIGELAINRNSLSLQNDKLQTSVKELLNRFANFLQLASNLREMSDQMLVAPDKFGRGMKASSRDISTQQTDDINSLFDSLEMDSYDNMYSLVQGLIEQMIQLEEAVDDIGLFAKQSGLMVEGQRQMLNNIRDELMWARMLPLGEVLNRFPRVLRDLSVKYKKPVNLQLNGTNVLVDRAALEKLYDPLVHLLRNAFDHGIELPEVRKKQGKPEEGTIEVKAYHQGNQTIIEIIDDGGGLNMEKIGNKAVERGLLAPEQLAVTNKENLLNLIFEPGFSTAAQVTDISGRGVGLDIVRSQLRSLKGSISVDSTPNQGTTFTLRLPLTLTIDKLLVLLAGPHLYALPSDNIEEIVVPTANEIKKSGNKRFLHYEDDIIPIYALSELLDYRCYISDTLTMRTIQTLPTPEDWGNPLLLLRQGQQLFAIEVNSLVSEQELVIKPFSAAITPPPYTYGCTILGDGTLLPVINASVLLEQFFNQTQPGAILSPTPITPIFSNGHGKTTSFQVSSVLVVDDSAAMRRTLALSLEKAGYRVLQARDGKEALEQLTQSSNINLVICDIEMPNMNGFEFLGQRRRHKEMMKIPVAMLTSRSNEKHQKLATHLGADAYFTKPYIEQKFLASIKKMIESN